MDKPLNLLIIDDNEEIIETLYDYFILKNQNIVVASSGLEGLKRLKEKTFDLVVTDIVLPNISGAGIISIIKKKYPNLPVIAITGWGLHPESLAAEVQADLVVGKPFEPSGLYKRILTFLAFTETDSIKETA